MRGRVGGQVEPTHGEHLEEMAAREEQDRLVEGSQAGDDPLRIPAEDRDVVQGYFSPQE